jgi:hypothetical protein
VTESDAADIGDSVLELERRQDEVLRELDLLSQRLELVLKQYAEDAAASKYAAACAPHPVAAKNASPSQAAA